MHVCVWPITDKINHSLRYLSPLVLKSEYSEIHYSDVIMGTMTSQTITCLTIFTQPFPQVQKKTSRLRVTGLCEGNSPVTGEFPTQRVSNAENDTILWRHHDKVNTMAGYALEPCTAGASSSISLTVYNMLTHVFHEVWFQQIAPVFGNEGKRAYTSYNSKITSVCLVMVHC